MATPWFWDRDQCVVLGPFTACEYYVAQIIAETWWLSELDEGSAPMRNALRSLLSPLRPVVRALVYFRLADLSSDDRRLRLRRRALSEMGFIVIFTV